MRRTPIRILPALLAIACSDSTAPGALASLAGRWDYTADRVMPLSSTTCNDTGTFTFANSDSGWIGTAHFIATCRQATSSYTYQEQSTIRKGVVTSTRFTFIRNSLQALVGYCTDTAVAVPGQGDALNGSEDCGLSHVTWHAVRAKPLVSVTLSPSPFVTVMGGVRTFDAILRVASGQRVFGRSITWATTNAAAADVALGVVTPVGVGTTTVSATAEGTVGTSLVTVLAPTSFVAVTAGDAYVCALGANQRVYCWGASPPFQGSQIPVPVQGAPTFSSISAGLHAVCGITAANEAWCWGRNESGQLGNGTTLDAMTPVRVPANGQSFARVSAGGRHACATATDGHAWCWGANDAGQIGNGSTTTSSSPVAVTGGLAFTALSAGDSHTCGLVAGGALYCWGSNTDGQLGDSATTNRAVPTLVTGSHTFQSIAAGMFHTCAIATGGSAYCWGRNDFGQFGNGTTTSVSYPVAAATGLTLASLSASLYYGCGITVTADAWCWGFNRYGTWGQLGNGSHAGSPSPVPVSGGLTWASITTGPYLYSDEATNAGTAAHTCAVATTGATWCWGDNLTGQLGIGTRTESYVPVKVSGQP